MAIEPFDQSFLHAHVYQGLWTRHDQPGYRNRIWTIKSNEAFYLMAAVAVLVGFAGSRSWVVARHVVLHAVGSPLRLHDPEQPEPLRHLAPGHAIWNALPCVGTPVARAWRRVFKQSGVRAADTPGLRNDPAQSPWFGALALINVVLFVAMGVAIPALLTDGAFGAPIVKSQNLESCYTTGEVVSFTEYLWTLPGTDAIFQQCSDRLNDPCDSQYYFTQPQMARRRLESCPFPGSVCQDGIQPFEILHANISAFEVGINSPSKMSLSHKLTCAPLKVDEFLLVPTAQANHSWISARTSLDQTTMWQNFSLRLSTVNGPNFLSDESSGYRMGLDGGPTSLTVLPRHIVPFSVGRSTYQKLIHEKLRRDDGQSFLIVNRAGGSSYFHEIDDPFFSAHNKVKTTQEPITYLPDYEATALGCVEQYQFCIPSSSGSRFCSQWGFGTQGWDDIFDYLSEDKARLARHYDAAIEKTAFFGELTQATSVYKYLALRNQAHPLTPLLRHQTSYSRRFESIDDLWIQEVETWFAKAFLSAISRIRIGAKYQVSDWQQFGFDPDFTNFMSREWTTCGRVLFRDGDFANINWVGFWCAVGSLSFICLVSFLVEQIHIGGQFLVYIVVHPRDTLAKIRPFLKYPRLLQSIRSQTAIMAGGARSIWRRIRSMHSPVGRRRLWYGRGATAAVNGMDHRRNVPEFRVPSNELFSLNC